MARKSGTEIRIKRETSLETIKNCKENLTRYIDEGNLAEAVICYVHLNDEDRARNVVNALQTSNQELEAKVKKYESPPFSSGVFLYTDVYEEELLAIIGVGSQTYEARFIEPPEEDLDQLPGRQVWLNEQRQIVKIGSEHVRGEAVSVLELLEGNRLKVRGMGSEEMVVEILPHVRDDKFREGDSVRIIRALGVVLEKLPQEQSSLGLDRIPDVNYEDIGGLDSQIQSIIESIEYPTLHRGIFEKYGVRRPKGILLHGPPGCGKTLVAKAIANSLSREIRQRLATFLEGYLLYLDGQKSLDGFTDAYTEWAADLPPYDIQTLTTSDGSNPEECLESLEKYLIERKINLEGGQREVEHLRTLTEQEQFGYFLTINGPEILNKYVGETESSIRRIFKLARSKATEDTPVVIFFDEIESLFSRRGSGISSDVENTIVPQLLSQIDGIDELGNVLIIGATNRFELIDPAVLRPGRFDVKLLIDRPNKDVARSILSKYILPEYVFSQQELEPYEGDVEKTIEALSKRIIDVIYSQAWRAT